MWRSRLLWRAAAGIGSGTGGAKGLYCGGKHLSETCNNKLDAKFTKRDRNATSNSNGDIPLNSNDSKCVAGKSTTAPARFEFILENVSNDPADAFDRTDLLDRLEYFCDHLEVVEGDPTKYRVVCESMEARVKALEFVERRKNEPPLVTNPFMNHIKQLAQMKFSETSHEFVKIYDGGDLLNENTRQIGLNPSRDGKQQLHKPTYGKMVNWSVLNILYGESGSGKTIEAVQLIGMAREEAKTDSVALYFSGDTVFKSDYSSEGRPAEEAEGRAATYAWIQRRNRKTAELLGHMIRFALKLKPGETLRGKENQYVYLLLDEMGSYPQYLRALCHPVTMDAVSRAVGASVRIIVAGTGCHVDVSKTSGSNLEPFVPMLMGAVNPDHWSQFYPAEMERINSDRTQARHYARGLLTNARSATCLFIELRLKSQQSLLRAVYDAAGKYRSLNGLSILGSQGLMEVTCTALALVMFGEQRELRSEMVRYCEKSVDVNYDFCEKDLITRFGVLRDTFAEKRNATQAAENDRMKMNLNKEQPRYVLSEAQSVMFLVQFGLSDVQASSGDGFELIIRDYLVLLFMAARMRKPSPQELLEHAFDSTKVGVMAGLSGRIDWGNLRGVCQVDAGCKLEADAEGAWRRQMLQEELDAMDVGNLLATVNKDPALGASSFNVHDTKELQETPHTKQLKEIVKSKTATQAGSDAARQLMRWIKRSKDLDSKRRTATELQTARNKVLGEVAGLVKGNSIAIVANAGKASFADLIVAFPPADGKAGVWWSVQVKRDPDTPLPLWVACDELSKMGIPGEKQRHGCSVNMFHGRKMRPRGKDMPTLFQSLCDGENLKAQQDKEVMRHADANHKARVEFAAHVGASLFGKPVHETKSAREKPIQVPCFAMGHGNGPTKVEIPHEVPRKMVNIQATRSSIYPMRAPFVAASKKEGRVYFGAHKNSHSASGGASVVDI